MATVIETQRLNLRELAPDDAPLILELLNDPDYLLHIGDRNVRSLEDARAYIEERIIDSYLCHGFGMYLVVLKGNGIPIGICGFVRRDGLDDVDIGYALLPAYRGAGYALEAARATLVYGVDELGLERVVALTSVDNEASVCLLEKLGYRFDRLIRLSEDQDECRYFIPGERDR